MSKWADYLISQIRYKETEHDELIDKLMVHKDNDNSISSGEVSKRKDVINKIDTGYTCYTIYKNSDGKWKKGARVEKILVSGTYYLRTDANKTKKDNLGELPNF